MTTPHDKSKRRSALGSDPFLKVVREDETSVKPEIPVEVQAEAKTQAETDFENDPEFKATKKTLEDLGKELDEFHRDPKNYNRKKLEGLVKDFIFELKSLLADSSYFARIREAMTGDHMSWTGVIKGLRRFIQSDEVDDYGLDRQFEMAIKPFFDFLYYKYFRVEVSGIQNIPYGGRTLLVANHSGVIPMDAAMMKVAIFNEHPSKRDLRFLVDDFVFHFPFMGTIMNRIGGVRACPENAERLLNHDEIVSVFPEGIKGISKLFKDRYQLERFGRGGVIRLAMKTKSPITPVAVIGAEEIYPLIFKSHILARPLGLPFIPFTPLFPFLGPLGVIPLPTKWKIHFGDPIQFNQYTSNDLNDDILINRETENLRQCIQAMIKQGIEERQSVFGM